MCGKQKSIIKFISAVSLFISLEIKVFFRHWTNNHEIYLGNV